MKPPPSLWGFACFVSSFNCSDLVRYRRSTRSLKYVPSTPVKLYTMWPVRALKKKACSSEAPMHVMPPRASNVRSQLALTQKRANDDMVGHNAMRSSGACTRGSRISPPRQGASRRTHPREKEMPAWIGHVSMVISRRVPCSGSS